jgi:Type IV secretion-system coupling protein DNA-binding domain
LLNQPGHGGSGLLLLYGLCLLGLWLGTRRSSPSGARLPARPRPLSLLAPAVLTALGAALIWELLWERTSTAITTVVPVWVAYLLSAIFYVLFATAVGRWLGRARGRPVLRIRGTQLLTGSAACPRSSHAARAGAGATSLTLAGESVPPLDETKHFKLLGTTGTGKSTAIRELLRGALARGDRAIIADPDGSYLEGFYDAQRADRILNPFDARAARWDLFAEIREPQDAEQLARSFVPDYEGSDRNWRHYARTLVSALLRRLHSSGDANLPQLYRLLFLAPAEELRILLAGTPAAPFLGSDNTRFFESVRSIAAAHLSALEHLANQSGGEPLSVRRWVQEGRRGPDASRVLFLPYRANEIAALRHVLGGWMRLAIFEAMNAEPRDQRLWFVVDELDALGAIDGLKDALARLRKFGGRCVLGLQSIAQVRGAYGEAEAQTIVENCANTLILRCSASERGGTAEFAARLIGRREILRQMVSRTRPLRPGGLLHQTRTVGEQYATEEAVMASEIEQLPDLAGFLKFASQPAWKRVRCG